MSKKVPNSIPKHKAPTSLMGVAKGVCQAPLFYAKTLAILGIQPIVTLRENGGTSNVMVRSEDTFVPSAIPHPSFEANCTKVSKVQLES
jgi:hypothetical protein